MAYGDDEQHCDAGKGAVLCNCFDETDYKSCTLTTRLMATNRCESSRSFRDQLK